MICKPFRNKLPRLHPTVRAAENAAVIGDVTCGRDVSIWYSVTVRGDVAPITVGEGTNLQDGAVLHCDHDRPITVGRCCTVGHGAIVHSCTVGDNTTIGMGATLLTGSRVGSRCIVGANALVTGNTVIPDGWLAMGVPAKAVRPLTEAELADMDSNGEGYVELAREQLPAAVPGFTAQKI